MSLATRKAVLRTWLAVTLLLVVMGASACAGAPPRPEPPPSHPASPAAEESPAAPASRFLGDASEEETAGGTGDRR